MIEEEVMNALGRFLKGFRNDKKMTTREIGDWLNVTSSYITQLEQGKRMPSKKKLLEIILKFQTNYKDAKIPKEQIIKEYCINKKATFSEILTEYKKMEEDFYKKQNIFLSEVTDNVINLGKAKIRLPNKEDIYNFEFIEKPYYNLAWLLKQDESEVLFLDDFNTLDDGVLEDEMPIFFSIKTSILTVEDKKMIYNILKQIFEHRFKEVIKHNTKEE